MRNSADDTNERDSTRWQVISASCRSPSPRTAAAPKRPVSGSLRDSDATVELTDPSMKLLFCSALLCCSAKAAWVQHPAVRFSGGATVPRAAVAATATEADPSAVKEEKYEFEAEVSKVMDIIINSLYSDKVRPP